jgi:hypothetical protein
LGSNGLWGLSPTVVWCRMQTVGIELCRREGGRRIRFSSVLLPLKYLSIEGLTETPVKLLMGLHIEGEWLGFVWISLSRLYIHYSFINLLRSALTRGVQRACRERAALLSKTGI